MSTAAYRTGFVEPPSGPLGLQPMVVVAGSPMDGVFVPCSYPCDRCGKVKQLHPETAMCASCTGTYRPLTTDVHRVE